MTKRRRRAMGFFLLGLLGLSVVRSAETPQWHTPPQKWTEPRIYHVPFDPEYAARVRLGSAPARDLAGKILSPNNAYWFALEPPDCLRPGPWNTVLTVSTERDPQLTLTLLDHSTYPVSAVWINEKLISVRVWWGRVRGADLLLDVERGTVIWQETFLWGETLFRQYHPETPPPAPSQASSVGVPPRLTLENALAAAGKHIKGRGLDLSGQHLRTAQLQFDARDKKDHYWLLVWSWNQARLGSEYSLWVYMDGTVVEHRLGP